MTGHRLPLDGYNADWDAVDPGSDGVLVADYDRKVYLCDPVTYNGARTLAVPDKVGLIMTIVMQTDDGTNLVVTTSSGQLNQAGDTIMTAADAGDTLVLMSIKQDTTLQWVVISNDGFDGS